MSQKRPVEVGKRIKELREELKLSLQELAERSGFSSALLSQFENHMVSPPLGVLVKLAPALGTGVGELLGDNPQSAVALVRAGERPVVSRVASDTGVSLGYTYEALGAGMKGRRMEPFVITLEPSAVKEKHLSVHEGEEFLFVLEGEMEVRLVENTDVLLPGDSLYFNSSTPHHVSCHGSAPARVLAVLSTGK